MLLLAALLYGCGSALRDERFKNLKNLHELSVMLVSIKRHEQYYVVYKLFKLVLILPIATASVWESVFHHELCKEQAKE